MYHQFVVGVGVSLDLALYPILIAFLIAFKCHFAALGVHAMAAIHSPDAQKRVLNFNPQ